MKLSFNLSHLGAAWWNVGAAVVTAGIVTGALDETLAGPGMALIATGLVLILSGCVETTK